MSKKAFEYTAEQLHLRHCELRIAGVKSQVALGRVYPENGDNELARLAAAREDILSRMSAEDHAALIKHETAPLSPKEKAAADKAALEAMESNKDSQSI